jgi:toxin-antitoxin system PIN domain toxin
MKTISLAVSEDTYETFRRAAQTTNRSIAHLIRDAMAWYETTKLHQLAPLQEIPLLPGHRLVHSERFNREEVYEDFFAKDFDKS